MFLFMHCNNLFPVNLKEQTLFEVTVPTSDRYQSKKKVEKIVPENFVFCSRKVNRRTDNKL